MERFDKQEDVTYMDGNTKITICYDYCVKTQEEVDKILRNIVDIYVRSLMKDENEKRTK